MIKSRSRVLPTPMLSTLLLVVWLMLQNSVSPGQILLGAVLAIAAGVDGPDALPPVTDNTSRVTVSWDPEKVADHTGVTATFGAPLAPGLTLVPDATIERGALRIDTEDGGVEDGPGQWRQAIAEALSAC